jgi:hypothetical protein
MSNVMEEKFYTPQDRKLWIKQARTSFKVGAKKPCGVCGKYTEVCEPHHVYPLWMQFHDGVDDPIHDHIWLCPTHHRIIHLAIRRRYSGYSFVETFDGESQALQRVFNWMFLYKAKFLKERRQQHAQAAV